MASHYQLYDNLLRKIHRTSGANSKYHLQQIMAHCYLSNDYRSKTQWLNLNLYTIDVAVDNRSTTNPKHLVVHKCTIKFDTQMEFSDQTLSKWLKDRRADYRDGIGCFTRLCFDHLPANHPIMCLYRYEKPRQTLVGMSDLLHYTQYDEDLVTDFSLPLLQELHAELMKNPLLTVSKITTTRIRKFLSSQLPKAFSGATFNNAVDEVITQYEDKLNVAIDTDAYRLTILKGCQISQAYASERGASSCMSGSASVYTTMYDLTPDHCKLIIVEIKTSDGSYKDCGRALLWTANNGKHYIDRVYYKEEYTYTSPWRDLSETTRYQIIKDLLPAQGFEGAKILGRIAYREGDDPKDFMWPMATDEYVPYLDRTVFFTHKASASHYYFMGVNYYNSLEYPLQQKLEAQYGGVYYGDNQYGGPFNEDEDACNNGDVWCEWEDCSAYEEDVVYLPYYDVFVTHGYYNDEMVECVDGESYLSHDCECATDGCWVYPDRERATRGYTYCDELDEWMPDCDYEAYLAEQEQEESEV